MKWFIVKTKDNCESRIMANDKLEAKKKHLNMSSKEIISIIPLNQIIKKNDRYEDFWVKICINVPTVYSAIW